MGAVAVAVQIFSGRKATGQAQRERVRIGLENALHAGRKRIPRVATVSQRGFDLGDVPVEAVATEVTEEVLLARITPIQGAVANARAPGNRGDGSGTQQDLQQAVESIAWA